MADYEKMYYKLFDATEKAINILIEAQKACEEIYMNDDEKENLFSIEEYLNQKNKNE